MDTDARTLTIRDNGIGMSRAEVVDLIGTLAKSGTAELRQQLRDAKNATVSEELIGQFGIGFYSTFMVADKVELLTHKAGDSEAIKWESSGDGTYTIEAVEGRAAGDVGDAPSQAGRCRGRAARLHLGVEAADAGQEVLRLHRLADPDGGREALRARRRRRDRHLGGRDPQLG